VLIQSLQQRTKLERPAVLAVVLGLLFLAGAFLGQLLLPELLDQFRQLGRDLPQLVGKLSDLLSSDPRLEQFDESIGSAINLKGLQPLLGFAGGAANTLIQFFLMILLAILLALDPKSHRRMLLAACPRPAREQLDQLLDEYRHALGGWLSGMTLSATTVFLLTWGGLLVLKAPLALLSALICGLLTFVPTIGPTAATLLPAGLALLQSPQLMVSVVVFRLILQNLEAFLLTPLLLRKTVNLLPTVALMAQFSLGALLGLPGVLLALPLVVVLQVLMQRVVVQQIMDRWA
jgi:predicted PurR-regulated permease PerM